MVCGTSPSKMLLLSCMWLGFLPGILGQSLSDINDGYALFTNISRLWGPETPYFSVSSTISGDLPAGCLITFAQVLSRHGARNPTASSLTKYQATITKIKTTVDLNSLPPAFEFLKAYELNLVADALVPFGAQQLINSGIKFFNRYKALTSSQPIFFRTSDQQRVIESAGNFTIGYAAAKKGDNINALEPSPAAPAAFSLLTISEDDNSNNTLNHGLCTAFEDGTASTIGDDAEAAFTKTFVGSIVIRLNNNLKGANLTSDDALDLMDLCSFDTVAKPNAGTLSPFCNLFTLDEWESYDYLQSVEKWYSRGLGNPLGPTQGVGFTNELIARLTNKAVVDHTSTNSTLDSSPKTFPLGLKLYADFSHDNDMVGIMTALGLFNGTSNLSTSKRESLKQTNGFSASTAVPYSSRVYVEKMQCSGQSSELVRILVNDRVIPLQNCGADSLGRCKLEKFTDSLSFAKQGGHFSQCFVNASSTAQPTASSSSIPKAGVVKPSKQMNTTYWAPIQFTGEGSTIMAGLGLVGFVVVWFNILAAVSL